MKICIGCKEAKNESEFLKRSGRPGQLLSRCKKCYYEQQEVYRKRNNYPSCSKERSAVRCRFLSSRWHLLKRKAKEQGYDMFLCLGQWLELMRKPCHYCKGSLSPAGYGLDRVDPSLGYTIDNVVPCCTRCNRSKNKMTEMEFRKFIVVVYHTWAKHVPIVDVEEMSLGGTYMQFENRCPACNGDAIELVSYENCEDKGYVRQSRRCANAQCREAWIDHVAFTDNTLIVGEILQRFRLRKVYSN